MTPLERVLEEYATKREAMKAQGYTEPVYECKECKDTGFIDWKDEDGYCYSRPCECKVRQAEQKRTLKLIEESGLQNKFQECTFENFQISESYQKVMTELCQKYLTDSENKWLLLSGQSGSGKTHLCVALCSELIKQYYGVRYLAWRAEGAKIKRNANNDEAYTLLIEPYKNCDVLYIDDLFKGGTTEADINLAFELLNHRYDRKLRTIISTELSMERLKSMDEAIAGRINEMCGPYKLFINKSIGRNWRDKA